MSADGVLPAPGPRKPRLVEGGGGPKWFETRRDGAPAASYRNAQVALETMGAVFSFDEFRQRAFVHWHIFGDFAVEVSDRRAVRLRKHISDRYGFDPTRAHITDAIAALCEGCSFDPVAAYLDGLVWDGKRRIDRWLHTHLGAEDTPINGEFGRKFLIAGVRRVRQPGCKFDYILILEGKQGAGKSTAIADLATAPDLFTDQDIIHVDYKAQQEAIAGRWIIEFSELNGFNRTDIERVKAFASRQFDRGRPAYGHFAVNQPRRCINFGTTNGDRYLSDPTGNRRFWPVSTGVVPWGKVKADRDQLWAEAAMAEASGESLEIDSELRDEAVAQQSAREELDPWDDICRKIVGEPHRTRPGFERVFTQQVLADHLSIQKVQQTKFVMSRLASCMRRVGWEGPADHRDGASVLKGYIREKGRPDDED